jgi:hypothetical protein
MIRLYYGIKSIENIKMRFQNDAKIVSKQRSGWYIYFKDSNLRSKCGDK